MHTPEFHEKQAICKFLDKIGPDHCWYFRPYMAGFGKSGVPDIIGCLYGSFFGIEVKRPNKMPTKLQVRRMSEIARTNGLALAGDAETVIEALQSWLAIRGIKA